jgi:hypothetical protein
MSHQAVNAWVTLSPELREHLEQVRAAMNPKHAPNTQTLWQVGWVLAYRHRPKLNYADPAVSQICADLHGTVSADQVQRALTCLERSGLWVTVRKSTGGKAGQAGSAPRRAPTFVTELEQGHMGADPLVTSAGSHGGNRGVTRGLEQGHMGADPLALNKSLNKTPTTEKVSEQNKLQTVNSHTGVIEQTKQAALKMHLDTDTRPVKNPQALATHLLAEFHPIVRDLVNKYPHAQVRALAHATLCKHRGETLSEAAALDLDPQRRDCPVCHGAGTTYADDHTDPAGLRRVMITCTHSAVA